MQVKLLKNWFDPEGNLRRARPEGVYIPGKYEGNLPKSAKVLSKGKSEDDESPVDQKDPNLLKNTDAGSEARAEMERLQKLVDAGNATNAERHTLKKLIEKTKPAKEAK